jgi:hypothetical protein
VRRNFRHFPLQPASLYINQLDQVLVNAQAITCT